MQATNARTIETNITMMPTTIAPTMETNQAVKYLLVFSDTIFIIAPTSKQEPKVPLRAKFIYTAGK